MGVVSAQGSMAWVLMRRRNSSLKAEQPRTVQDQKRQRPIPVQADMPEDALKPATGLGGLHPTRPLAGDVAEVHAAGADHADDDQAERLHTALAEIDLGAQDLQEDGYGVM